jgi:hypothetical protein
MANPVTHKAISIRFRSNHHNRSTILLSRFPGTEPTYPRLPPKGVTGLTLFPPLPYHPPHASKPNHLLDHHHGGCLGGVPR